MRDRIMGEEIEWTGSFRQTKDCQWVTVGSAFEKIAKFMNSEPSGKYCIGNNNFGGFIENGSRVYHETSGQSLETASPECSSAREVLKFDKWAERFVCSITKKLNGKFGEFVFCKKNSNVESSSGCHENYFSEKMFLALLNQSEIQVDPKINYFILFLITRQIFSGSGGIMLYSLKGMGADIYEISPRTHFISLPLGKASTASGPGRPIIHIRDESLTDNDGKYFRNHLILGDANMADLSIFLKFGTTSAIIEMIEEGFWSRDLCLEDPNEASKILRAVSKDLTLKNVSVRLKNGKSYAPLQIQRKFCQNWRRYLKYTQQVGEKLEIAERWHETLDRLAIDDKRLYCQLDWKIKMKLILDFVTKKNLPLNHEKVINIDNLYHSPDPKISFYYLLKSRSGLQFEDLVSESEILDADITPPQTRAKLRSYLAKLCRELGLVCCPSWDNFSFQTAKDVYDKKIHMPDPRLSSLLSLNIKENLEAINYLNNLKPGAIILNNTQDQRGGGDEPKAD